MSQIQVTGTLSLPLSAPSKGTKLRFTCSSGELTVLKTATQVLTTDINGGYSFNLKFGMYIIEVMYSNQWNFLGNVLVNEATPVITDINTLLEDHLVPIPDSLPEDINYSTMVMRGDWDASGGEFPPAPIYPTKLSYVYRVSNSGNMANVYRSDLNVSTNDLIYWSFDEQNYNKVNSGVGIGVELGEGELAVGNAFGSVEARTFEQLFNGLPRLYTLDGTSTSITITHNRNRRVQPIFFNASNIVEYPVYTQPDDNLNILIVEAGGNLEGTLMII